MGPQEEIAAEQEKQFFFWTKPDPPYFLTKTHNDPNLGGILGEFG